MNQLKKRLYKSLDTFKRKISCLPASDEILIGKIIEEIDQSALFQTRSEDFLLPAVKIEKIIRQNASIHNIRAIEEIRKQLVMILALNLPNVLKNYDLPESILTLYEGSLERMSSKLSTSGYDIENSSYSLDIRLVLGMTVPCGAQVVDLTSKVPVKSIVKTLLLNGNFNAAWQFTKIKGWRTWFRIHTDSNYLDEFNAEGWDDCYKRIAQLLIKMKDICGMVGTSWFYDPKLIGISPRLAYLQNRPLENGAFLIKHGTGPIHTERATRTSKTRRRYYEEGKYMPTCYSLIWPRQKMINWYESTHG